MKSEHIAHAFFADLSADIQFSLRFSHFYVGTTHRFNLTLQS